MKREIPLLGLVLVLALLLILPVFQVISTHAFVCNISTVLSNVGGCYVYISAKFPFGCKTHGYFITENGIVGSLFVCLSVGHHVKWCGYQCTITIYTTSFFVYGYIIESGNLASHYIKPLSYIGYSFILPAYGHVVFYCLTSPPKSLYYLGCPQAFYFLSCFVIFRYFCPEEVMPSIIGFRVPLDDIFYYILSPSLFCGTTIVKTPQTKMISSWHYYGCFGSCYWKCCAFIQRLWGRAWWGGYWICRVFWTPVTATFLTYSASLGHTKYTGTFCLIGTFLSSLPTKTITCSFILPTCCLFCYFRYVCFCPYATYAIRTESGYVSVLYGWWYPCFGGPTTMYYGTFTTLIFKVYGGLLINYLPYCTEYLLFYGLYYTSEC